MTTSEISQFIRENPKYRTILEKAVDFEERNATNPNWLGWEWYEVRAYPAQLVKLVIAGVTDVKFKSNSSTNYLLADREATKQALQV